MCGIAGVLDPRGCEREELRLAGTEMADRLFHRGPDDGGVWVDVSSRVVLANRRLAVVGLGAGGHQPMSSNSGRWTVTFNGEIYNHAHLRRELSDSGTRFKGGSDTEVLLEGVETWGLERALERCEGMFAFALWDAERHELHLARDRLGEKPLYYGWVSGRFAFASELKALRRLRGFSAPVDRGAVTLFLRHNCIPAPLTIYEGVFKLEPAQLLTVGPGVSPGGEPRLACYWSAREVVEGARHDRLSVPDEDLVARVEGALIRAVGARMLADVPVGAFLSGGVDSSLVVALMQEQSSRPVKTFTVGFKERAYDESQDAERVAAHLGTDHETLELTDKEALEVVPELAEVWDEPFADSSQIPMLLVSRLARSQVTVALSGDGGDELFGGYNRHAWLERLWRRSAWLPPSARRLAGSLMQGVPPGLVDSLTRLESALPKAWRVRIPATKLGKAGKVIASGDPESAYLALVSHWDEPEKLVVGGRRHDSLASMPSSWAELDDVTAQMLWLDLVGYLPDDILTKLDRASMAASLEARAPFLDRSVVELAWRLPASAKLRPGATKWVLRQALYRRLPRQLVERPKMGFGIPIGAWLRGPLRQWAEELLAERKLRAGELLEPAPILEAWKAHKSGRRDLGYELWDVLSLLAWLDRWAPA